MFQTARQFVTKTPRYWLAIWAIFYAAILGFSIFAARQPILDIIKVASIALCFIYVAIVSPKDRLLMAALFVTFIADFFLAFNNTSPTGLAVFVIAQFIHLFRVTSQRRHPVIAICATLAAFIITICFLTEFAPPIYAICTIYLIVIICNIMACWNWHRTEPQNLPAALAAYGFILFACCDFWTGVSYLSLTAVLPAALYGIANFLAWFFYYPSQILISNSGKCATMKTVEGKS